MESVARILLSVICPNRLDGPWVTTCYFGKKVNSSLHSKEFELNRENFFAMVGFLLNIFYPIRNPFDFPDKGDAEEIRDNPEGTYARQFFSLQ